MQKPAFLAWIASVLLVHSAIGKDPVATILEPRAEKGTVHFQTRTQDRGDFPSRALAKDQLGHHQTFARDGVFCADVTRFLEEMGSV